MDKYNPKPAPPLPPEPFHKLWGFKIDSIGTWWHDTLLDINHDVPNIMLPASAAAIRAWHHYEVYVRDVCSDTVVKWNGSATAWRDVELAALKGAFHGRA